MLLMLKLPRVKVEAWAASFKEIAAIDDEELRKARARKLKEKIMSSNLLGDGRSHSKITQDDLVPYDPSTPFCIVMTDENPNLLVLDADSKEAAEFIDKYFPTPTLIQKTLKGAHYFFILPEGFDTSQLKSHTAIHGLEVFTYASHRAIFGGNCDYYTHINNGVTAPRLITEEELGVLIGKKAARNFTPTPHLISKARALYDAISQENYDADYLAFLCNNLLAKQIESEGKKDLRDFDSSSGGRNNLINSIIFTYMRSSVFDTKQKLIDLALCVNSLFSESLPKDEVLALVKNKWRHSDDAAIKLNTPPVSLDKPIPPLFIARSLTSNSNKASTYWLIETEKDEEDFYTRIIINEISSRDIEVLAERADETKYGVIKEQCYQTEPKKNKAPQLKVDDSKLPIAVLTEGDPTDFLFQWRAGVLYINTAYFFYSYGINKRRNKKSPYTQDELLSRFKTTRFYPLIEKQWFTDPTIRMKFFGDIQHCLKNKCGLNTMCTLKSEGNAGKSWGLIPLLSSIFLGKPQSLDTIIKSKAFVFDSSYRAFCAPAKTAATLIKSNFSVFPQGPLGIIDDDGITLSYDEKELLWEILKGYIKAPIRTIEEKYKQAFSVKNTLFLVRFTNDLSARAPQKTTNNRFYFSYCVQDKNLEQYIKHAYPNEEFTITNEEYEATLDFIMFYDFNAAGYIGFNKLPPEIEEGDESFFYELRFASKLLKSGEAITSESITLKILISFFDIQNKCINTKKCLAINPNIDEDGYYLFYPLAQFLLSRHSLYGKKGFYPDRSSLYKILRDLNLPIGAEVNGRVGELMKAYKSNDKLKMFYKDSLNDEAGELIEVGAKEHAEAMTYF